ncbi:hypothetical protein AQUCO_04600011v1 [Aquilegia coerulea]|uniref:Homeobox domain-containing protein n=1 Tax=Aquilegia coerulea TaxID=218851 RepID=A0A2G5CL74_AQUCA|nr:hypothetical protein AQUCO_04600011v1 [Aquilegia coerulea]
MSPAASTRWCPTPEQLMILEEMYRGGIKTPNATQIQQITAHLSLYGKIEGKNVFYWFQNHKARDRQKLRRKLCRQQQQQLQHLEGLLEEASNQVINNTKKMDNFYVEAEMDKWMKIYGNYATDYTMMMDVAQEVPPCCINSTKPLKTLELFPIKSTTSFRDECSTSKSLITSSTMATNY